MSHTPLRLLTATALLALSTCLAACQRDDEKDAADAEGPTTAAGQDAMLEYAACMRENGVPMEDPRPGERGLLVHGGETDPEVLRAAEQRCGALLEDVLPPDGGGEIPAEQKEALLASAQCMRDRGWNVQDPQFDGGRVTQRLDSGGGIDPGNPEFRADAEECAQEAGVELPGAPRKEG